MHIFIDESGTFTRSATASSVSTVGALTIPDTQLPRVARQYRSIRRTLPLENGEVKGRRLSEPEIARVVSLLAARDVLFELSAIDLSLGEVAEFESHQAEQAAKITAGLPPGSSGPVTEFARNLRARLEVLPPQLYAQSVITFSLVARVLDHSTLYYVQRRPNELAAFHWVVDAKERSRTTDWEDWWSCMIMPWLQSKSLKEPGMMIMGEDYSHFRRFDMAVPSFLKGVEGAPKGETVTDIRKVMTESFRFSATAEPGLELVDILTNATRRAMIGNLKIAGWGNIRRLMIRSREQTIEVKAFGTVPRGHRPSYSAVIRHFRDGGRSMLTH